MEVKSQKFKKKKLSENNAKKRLNTFLSKTLLLLEVFRQKKITLSLFRKKYLKFLK